MKIACIQTNAQADIRANIAAIEPLVAESAQSGAQLIALPENAFQMIAPGTKADTPAMDAHEGINAAKEWVYRWGVYVLVGSVAVKGPEGKSLNRSLLIGADGKICAQYDKIHLFDVELPNGESYKESARFSPGEEAVVTHTPMGYIGMTICYDVRFPHLYRTLAKNGAQILTVPAAFTYTTGTAHWHTLLRARAIETGCFVIAPAQCGMHPGGRRTYGHSLIINPWGEIIAEGSEDKTGVIMANIDLAEVEAVRGRIPSLKHDREFTSSPPAGN